MIPETPHSLYVKKAPNACIRLLLVIIALLCAGTTYTLAQSADQNYTAVRMATAPVTDTSALKTRPFSDVKVIITYADGFGQPLQTVTKQGSLETAIGTNKDLVSFSVPGSKSIDQYLPYAASGTDGSYRSNAIADQASFYTSASSPLAGQNENHFYAETQYEASPGSSRPVESLAPGASWMGAGRGVQQKYYFNTVADSVKQWMVTDVSTPGSGFAAYSILSTYAKSTLNKNITVNEIGKQVIVYTDASGNTILKKVQLTAAADNGSGSGYTGWLCTYYIYDDAGKLRCVIQPAGVAALAGSGWSLTQSILDEQCFRYEYDARGLPVIKKTPGVGETHVVYDALSRPVLVQDANLRSQSNWIATQYDGRNRPVYTYTYNTATAFTALLAAAAASSSYPTATPPASPALLTQTHYDDYTGLPSGLSASLLTTWNSYFFATSTTVFPYPVMPAKNTLAYGTNGMVTWVKTKVLCDTTPAQYLASVNIFDDKGRLIQSQHQNITGGVDVTTIQYSWAGQPLIVVDKTQKGGANAQTTVTVTRITYDNLNRPVKTEMRQSNTKVKSGAMSAYATISQLQYDALGNVKTKLLGDRRTNDSTYNTTPLETQAFDYNIRGWLLGVNRAYARDKTSADTTTSTGQTTQTLGGESFTESTQDLQSVIYPSTNFFGFDLGYDKTNNNLINGLTYTAAQYTGNITGMVWKSAHDKKVRKYDYIYDAASRLTAANFGQYTGHAFTNATVNYTANNLAYDANGNIATMNQYGLKSSGTSGIVDQLAYTYNSGTNRPTKVADAAAVDSAEHLGDFQDGNTSGNDYAYDANGNLVSDANKKIASIAYNYLNLPSVIRVSGKGSIYYTYDAAGNKLSRKTVDSTVLPARITTTLYLGGSIYRNDTLQFFGTSEGRARPNAANTAFVYDYFLKDHLGNTRMVITDDYDVASPILEANSYYPFGLEMKNISLQAESAVANKYKFNGGSEYNGDLGIDYYETNFRSLDPQLGRFWQSDPLSEETADVSPYAFVNNNPVGYLDPLGLDTLVMHPEPGVYSTYTTGGDDVIYGEDETSTGSLHYISPGEQQGMDMMAGLNSGTDATSVPHDVKRIPLLRLQYAQKVYNQGWRPYRGNGQKNIYDGKIKYHSEAIQPTASPLDFMLGAGEEEVLEEMATEGAVEGAAKTGSSVLSAGDALRIENAATRIGKPITVVGSRAEGTAGAFSDWDYVIEGLNNKSWKQIKNSLPGSKSVLDNTPRNIDIFKTLDPTKPHITIYPQ